MWRLQSTRFNYFVRLRWMDEEIIKFSKSCDKKPETESRDIKESNYGTAVPRHVSTCLRKKNTKKCVIFEAIHSFFKGMTSKTGPGSSMEANLYQFCACDWNVNRLGRVIKEWIESNLVVGFNSWRELRRSEVSFRFSEKIVFFPSLCRL